MRLPRGRTVRLLALVLAYVAGAAAVLGGLVWSALPPDDRAAVGAALGPQAGLAALGGALALAGLAALLVRLVGPYAVAVRRLTGDVRLLLDANPEHRPDPSGPSEVAALARVVAELADRRQDAEREVAREVAAARADVEQERNRLAALMADLTVAVVVCSAGGRIQLYNSAARALLADDPALGLGRSVFGIVDRGLVAHALERISAEDAPGRSATVLRDGRLLLVRLAPVRSDGEAVGFVLVLEDMTSQVQASRRRDELLRGVTEATRASLASIRAAVENVLDYPDMEPDERRQFVEIILEESQLLGARVEGWVAEAGSLGGDGLLTDIRGEDLLTLLARDLERETDLAPTIRPAGADVWVRVDSHAVATALTHLATRLRGALGVAGVELSLECTAHHARLDARWQGRPPDGEDLRRWLDEPLRGAAGTARDVLERHDAEVWTGGGAATGDGPPVPAYLRLLLPVSDPGAAPEPRAQVDLDSRPEFYDFDLFDPAQQSPEWRDRALADLAYTVFDTETTGFHPDAGDEIVSIGAVRVVNGRLLRSEVFERLVDPRRGVPAESSAVHGITTDMVRGQPPLEQVLPVFARFAEDTVLVGHNVGFDMGFLRKREDRTGVHLGQPVLDTLLLDAAVHPDHEQHSLEAVAARLGVDVTGRHTALGDALVTGEVFVRLLALLKQRGIDTLGEALAASQATYQARLDAKLYGS